MIVKDVVKLAVSHIHDLFEHEELSNLGLEEVEYDDVKQEWVVTVGFSRPWDYPTNTLAAITPGGGKPHRSFKVVLIDENAEEIISIKNHTVNKSE